MIRYLSLDDVLYLAARLGEPTPRDAGLVASAVARPQTTVFGDDAYPDLHTKAAALLHSLARNHAFVDGNKRVSWLAAGAFYWVNGFELDAPEDPAYDLVISVATGDLDAPEIAEQLSAWVRPRS
ncbi:type II toxin-antitoxin system death-on-curing family toxin [uncultured Jatrophihabitans sp.]|uniref:type II toxin-antitoxin system death-on-curing family toxin n=1 Tax=uncultured Jatrophihabitans sp. TaxID=1610747 RepID=UPI0035CBFD30